MTYSVEPQHAAVVATTPVTPHSTPQPLIPAVPALQQRTYASALSYVGATRRTTAWVRKVSTSPASAIVAWTAAACWLCVMYLFLMAWYVLVFGLFGVFTFPWRLIRRSQRKQQHVQETQLATMQAMMVQQQQAMIQQRQGV